MKKLLSLLLLIALGGCASSQGFDRGNLRNQISGNQTITEDDIKKALELKPQLPNPFKIAIYLSTPINRYSHRSWNWVADDKKIFLEIGSELKKKNIISDIFIIGQNIADGTNNKAIRLAAARAGADAVLIVNGISDIDRYNNPLAITYSVLVPMFLVPGTEADGLAIINASLWDVRNQYLYLSAESEGKSHQIRPAVFIEESDLIKEAKSEAIKELAKEISERLQNMATK